MKRLLLAPALVAFALSTAPVDGAAPVVSNLTAVQRTGTKLVDIGYSVTADAPTVKVTLEVSADGGTTWSVPVATVAGDIGPSVAPGTGKAITWNAGTDWNEQHSSATRFRLTVDDLRGSSPAEFALIPGGSFIMGRTSVDTDSSAAPVTVSVSPFYVEFFEVSKSKWDEVRIWADTHGYTDLSAGGGKAGNHPVHTVSWYDALKWCNARSQRDGLTPCYGIGGSVLKTGTTAPSVIWTANGYRLPTEAEWEKSARGSVVGKRFPSGFDTITHGEANYRSSTAYGYDISPTRDYHPSYATGSLPYTSPVGSFAPTANGLYDMAGNVREWCWAWSSSAYDPSDVIDPRGPASGPYKITRSASWECYAPSCRAGGRGGASAAAKADDLGFRVVRGAVADAGGFTRQSTQDTLLDTRFVVLAVTWLSNQGSIMGSGRFTKNATATLIATPAPGYLFTGWTGDASGTANPLSVLMDSDKTIAATFAPDTRDDDGDGLTNFQEIVEMGTDPTKEDTDGDGVKDKTDAFPLNPAETLDTDHDGIGDNADPDDDGDGYSDADEINIHHTNPKRADSDGDGLTDPAEIQTHQTNPNLADSDSDGLRDGEEFTTHHTNPLVPDSDGDGFLDGYEVLTGHAPLIATDKPALVAEARTAIEFTFPAAVGKTYRIEASTDLVTWEIVESGIAGTGGQVQRFYSTRGQPKRYFRVEEETP